MVGSRGTNLSLVVGNDPAAALANRERLAQWVGAPVSYARQVHGSGVHTCVRGGEPPGEADALVTADPRIAVAVLVADCVPVLVAEGSVVAAVHAGRAGVIAGVVAAAVAAMVRLGAVPSRARAVVGPAICGSCYELPADLQAEVEAVVPGAASRTSWGTPAVDLAAAVRSQLAGCGIEQVSSVGSCTMEDPRWFSHRGWRAGALRAEGRFAAVVRSLPPQVTRAGVSPSAVRSAGLA